MGFSQPLLSLVCFVPLLTPPTEAEKYAAEDKEVAERVQAKNALES